MNKKYRHWHNYFLRFCCWNIKIIIWALKNCTIINIKVVIFCDSFLFCFFFLKKIVASNSLLSALLYKSFFHFLYQGILKVALKKSPMYVNCIIFKVIPSYGKFKDRKGHKKVGHVVRNVVKPAFQFNWNQLMRLSNNKRDIKFF